MGTTNTPLIPFTPPPQSVGFILKLRKIAFGGFHQSNQS